METVISVALDRVAQGMATEADAEALRRRLFPDENTRIVGAYLTLSCNVEAVRRHIAPDLRRALAEMLVEED